MSAPVPPTVGGGKFGDDEDLSLRSTSVWADRVSTGVQSVVAGTNVTVDNTDPQNPVVSSSGGSLLVATANLTAEDLFVLDTVAFELVPAVEGAILIPLACLFMSIPGTGAFGSTGDFQAGYFDADAGDVDFPNVFMQNDGNRPNGAILEGEGVRLDWAFLQPNWSFATPTLGFATQQDSSQSWQEAAALSGMPIKLWSASGGFDNGSNNTLDSVPASAVVVDSGEFGNMGVTAPDGTGAEFNAGSVEVGGAEGAGNEDRAMSVAFDSGTFTLTVTLGTDSSGDYDDTKNTFTLIQAAIELLPAGFTCNPTSGSLVAAAGSYPFSGGLNAVDMGLRVVTWYVLLELPT